MVNDDDTTVKVVPGEGQEPQPKMECPICEAEYDDFDGIGVVYCPKCGFCRHLSLTKIRESRDGTKKDERWRCDACKRILNGRE